MPNVLVLDNQYESIPEPQKIAIGTNYSRVIPSREINSKDRSNFWKKEEEMERIRVEAERGKQMSIKLELEKVSIHVVAFGKKSIHKRKCFLRNKNCARCKSTQSERMNGECTILNRFSFVNCLIHFSGYISSVAF